MTDEHKKGLRDAWHLLEGARSGLNEWPKKEGLTIEDVNQLLLRMQFGLEVLAGVGTPHPPPPPGNSESN